MTNAKMNTVTLMPMAIFSPPLIPAEAEARDSGTDDDVLVGSIAELVTTAVVASSIALTFKVFIIVLEEVVVGGSDARKTRNPGLDNSGVFGSNVGAETLKRRTYFALADKLLSGI